MIEIYAVFFLYNHKTCWNLKQLFSSYRYLCLGHLFCKFSLLLRIDLLHCSRYKLADKGMRFDKNNLCNSLKTYRWVWRFGRSHDLVWGKHRPWAQSTTSTHTPPVRLEQKSADRAALNTAMYCLLKCAPLFLAVAVCNGWLFGDFGGKQKELDEISLWPLPQKFQSSAVAFKLSPASFQIVHSKQSSAGPSCSLLENAFRR